MASVIVYVVDLTCPAATSRVASTAICRKASWWRRWTCPYDARDATTPTTAAAGRTAAIGRTGEARRTARKTSTKVHELETIPVHQPKSFGGGSLMRSCSFLVGGLVVVTGGMAAV